MRSLCWHSIMWIYCKLCELILYWHWLRFINIQSIDIVWNSIDIVFINVAFDCGIRINYYIWNLQHHSLYFKSTCWSHATWFHNLWNSSVISIVNTNVCAFFFLFTLFYVLNMLDSCKRKICGKYIAFSPFICI